MNMYKYVRSLVFVSMMGWAFAADAAFDPTNATTLTGVYQGNDGGMYYVRALPTGQVFWFGEHPSGSFANVMHGNLGRLEVNGLFDGTLKGGWVDVPKGRASGAPVNSYSRGIDFQDMTLQIDRPRAGEMQKVTGTGIRFGGSHWTPAGGIGAPRVVGYDDTVTADNLTGTWLGSDGGTYYVRQVGPSVAWFGSGCDSNSVSGYANVFFGNVSGSTISGAWADVPYGTKTGSGSLALSNVGGILRQTTPLVSGFGATSWTHVSSLMSSTVSWLNVTIKTGADDLRRGSIVRGSLVLSNGTTAASGGLQRTEGFPAGFVRNTRHAVRSDTTFGSLRGASYVLTLNGSPRSFPDAYDQWDVAGIQVSATLSSGQTVCLLQSFNSFRLKDEVRSQTLPLPAF